MNVTNSKGQSCVHVASAAGHVQFLRLLIEHDAELDSCDCSGRAPLHLSIGEAGAEAVGCLSQLLQGGADVEVTDREGRTPLLLAVSLRHLEAVRCLLGHGADTNCRDCQGD